MSETKDLSRRTNPGPRVMKDILKALKNGSSAAESVSNVKVPVSLPALAELLSAYLGADDLVTSDELETGAPMPGAGKSVVKPTLGSRFASSD